MICDFCNTPNPPVEFPTRDFKFAWLVPGFLGVGSQGSWWACTTCAEAVNEGRWEALLERSWAAFLGAGHHPANYRPDLKANMRKLHQTFQQLRIV